MLDLRNIRNRYGAVHALDGVSLSVAQGELVSLLGPSGCGKSTLLNTVSGFVTPDAGEVLIAGEPVGHLPPHRRPTAMVFQSYALFPHLDVFSNVAFGLRIRRQPSAVVERKVKAALDLVKLADFGGRLPRQLSGGQQQRVALARALVVEPKVLLLDEPFSNLDAKLREQMRIEVRALQRQVGVTTLFVTHDQEEAFELGDRVVLMNRGRIEQIGTAADLYEQPRTMFVADFIGRTNVLDGRVLRLDGEDAVVGIAADRQVEIRARMPDARPGQAVRLLLRPEQIAIATAAAGSTAATENRLEGRIALAVHLGAAIRYSVETAGPTLMVMAQAAAGMLETGRPVTVTFGRRLTAMAPDDAAGAAP